MAPDEQLLYRLVGERIRIARQRHAPPMSQAQLAEKLKLSRASIVNIEAGRQRPPLHVLWQIAEVLGTELSLLIPSQAEYIKHEEAVELDEQTAAQIEAAASGDVTTRRLLTEFVGRVRAHK
jgi:transcriptional regulator with XRE-family HTH domain